MSRTLDDFMEGKAILGDDYSIEEIRQWFNDEAQGYAEIVPEEHKHNFDEYKNLTEKYLYRHIKGDTFKNALIYGGGYGTEILPIIKLLGNIVILEPGNKFKRDYVGGKKVTYVVPAETGTMVFENESFDLIMCLGVLHHVPNVSYILREFYRVLTRNGKILIREPIRSMHIFDSRMREGMTKRERGIPLWPFRDAIRKAGLNVEREVLHGFGPLTKLNPKLQYSMLIMKIDEMLCKIFEKNYTYNAYAFHKKFCPTTVSFILSKR